MQEKDYLKNIVNHIVGFESKQIEDQVLDIIIKMNALDNGTTTSIAELINYNPHNDMIEPLTQSKILGYVELVCKELNIKIENINERKGGLPYFYNFKLEKIAKQKDTLQEAIDFFEKANRVQATSSLLKEFKNCTPYKSPTSIREGGVLQLGYHDYADCVYKIIRQVVDGEIIQDYREQYKLIQDKAIDELTLSDLKVIFTYMDRGERFCDGLIAVSFIDTGKFEKLYERYLKLTAKDFM